MRRNITSTAPGVATSATPHGWELPSPRRPAFLNAISLALDPEGYFEGCRARRGDPFLVRLPRLGDLLTSGHPEGAREFFFAPPETFDPLQQNPLEPLLGTHALILLAGERHKRERKLMSPPFHGERMRAYGEIMQGRTLAEARGWRVGDNVSMQATMRAITLDVILRAVLGIEGEPRSERFRRAVGAMLDAYVPPLLLVPALRHPLFGPWSRFVKTRDTVCELFRSEIAERRRVGTAGRQDILSLLMDARYDDGSALTEGELVDELRQLIVGGQDTLTSALVWGMFHLHWSPAALESLRAELAPLGPIPSPEALAQLPYLGAVCDETLRMYPIVPIVPRRAAQPLSFRGHPVLPGQNIALAITLLHTNEEVWPEPHRFLPERFVGKKYAPYEYAPFGGGARRCLGAAFSSYQMRIVLGTLIASTRFAPHEGPVPARIVMSIVMAPRGTVKLKVTRAP
jgi:cytochrome P450